jgi:O-antigen/teichoic acid export membrane protein
VLAVYLSRGWPWKQAFAQKLEWAWYSGKIKTSFNLYLTDVMGIINYYLNRYIVTFFLSLEMTGVYVFFSQIVTATCNLINSGVLVVYRPRLIAAHDSGDFALFNEIFRLCLKRTLLSTVGLVFLASLAVPLLVTYTEKEPLLKYLPLLWVMLGALLLKAGEIAAELGLFAMHKDREAFVITLVDFLITVAVGSLGVIFFGVYGIVANSFIVSLVAIFYARNVWNRQPPATYKRMESYV